MHWSEYSGFKPLKDDLVNVIIKLMVYSSMLKFNVINYHKPVREQQKNEEYMNMIYTKLPERLLYGLLRGYGYDVKITAEILIEYSKEYEIKNLHDFIKQHLNIQSLYRGEKFSVNKSLLIPKGYEIGIELTDIILGIVRTILKNKQPGNSKGEKERNTLVIELLRNNSFYNFLSKIKSYEWTYTKDLKEITFNDYLQLFLAESEEWQQYLFGKT